jgi:hypothetical protein
MLCGELNNRFAAAMKMKKPPSPFDDDGLIQAGGLFALAAIGAALFAFVLAAFGAFAFAAFRACFTGRKGQGQCDNRGCEQ